MAHAQNDQPARGAEAEGRKGRGSDDGGSGRSSGQSRNSGA